MDKKIEIKEEDPLTDDQASQNEREFLHEFVSLKTSIDTVLDDTDCNMTVKMEVKSETPFIRHPVEQIKTESATCSNWEMLRETELEHQTLFSDFGSQNERGFLPEDSLMVDKEYNSDQEMYKKIEITEESCSAETEIPSVSDNIKEVDIPAVNSSRLYLETVAGATLGNSPLLSGEVPAKETRFCDGIVHLQSECIKCDGTEILPEREDGHSDEYGKCSDETDMYIEPISLKHKNLSYVSKMPQQCSICAKTFSSLSHLKSHIIIHEGKKLHQCKTCSKIFTRSDHLKRHNLIHEGQKLHQCKICDKRFTILDYLKRHHLVHEGNKLHKCQVCNKSFTHLSGLKTHNLIHEGKKPHQCKVCDKRFTQLSNLKTHHLVHDVKKTHKCQVCDKSFTHLSNLKTHNLLHEGKKPHQCKVCNKSFAQLSTLKRHNLVHEGKKDHTCNVCNKSFTYVLSLKTHSLIHEGKKPHQCKVCGRRFTHLSNLKSHNLVHEGKKPYQCKVCAKCFTQSSHLKKHNLVHAKLKNSHSVVKFTNP